MASIRSERRRQENRSPILGLAALLVTFAPWAFPTTTARAGDLDGLQVLLVQVADPEGDGVEALTSPAERRSTSGGSPTRSSLTAVTT